MVFVLLESFRALTDEELVVKNGVDTTTIIFEKLDEKKHRHLKPLYIEGFINGKPVRWMLVDTGP